MIEWPLLIVAGLLGSSHCLGMCGPFALAIGSGCRTWHAQLVRQVLYTSGRISTYSALGALAGYGGARLAGYSGSLVNVPAVLALLAGAVLCYQGLLAAGLVPRKHHVGSPCLAGTFFGMFLRRPGISGIFLAGLFTGLLPCGLLYGTLALAASTHTVWKGIAVMALFGLGTAPAMMAAGWSGSLLSVAFRKQMFAVAAWCLVLTGAISMVRGTSYLLAGEARATAEACPLCK